MSQAGDQHLARDVAALLTPQDTPTGAQPAEVRKGVIVAVTAAGPPAMVTVRVAKVSTPVAARCVYGYAPSAGHNVAVLIVGGDLLVLG